MNHAVLVALTLGATIGAYADEPYTPLAVDAVLDFPLDGRYIRDFSISGHGLVLLTDKFGGNGDAHVIYSDLHGHIRIDSVLPTVRFGAASLAVSDTGQVAVAREGPTGWITILSPGGAIIDHYAVDHPVQSMAWLEDRLLGMDRYGLLSLRTQPPDPVAARLINVDLPSFPFLFHWNSDNTLAVLEQISARLRIFSKRGDLVSTRQIISREMTSLTAAEENDGAALLYSVTGEVHGGYYAVISKYSVHKGAAAIRFDSIGNALEHYLLPPAPGDPTRHLPLPLHIRVGSGFIFQSYLRTNQIVRYRLDE